MSLPSNELRITHQCLGCNLHHPEHKIRHQSTLACPVCGSTELESLLSASEPRLPRFHAQQDFQNSTFAYAHAHGINGIELDALAQAIQRLMKHSNTIITNNQAESLQTMAELGYIKLEPTTQGTQQVDLLCPSALLSSYFWSVWVPHHLQSRGYQVAVLPNLEPVGEVQHCTVVFRVIGTRESSSDFLVKLAEKFNDQQEAEIVHIQAGHLDQYQGGRT